MKYIAAVSPEAQDLGDSIDFISTKLDDGASALLPVASAVIFFSIGAWVIKRLIYS